ncbi:MAG: NAD(+)/NADH kinase [Veillonellaceae bacterium]|nr:NAD(+)/NADH kinase [Veillonellaceae bacterium]
MRVGFFPNWSKKTIVPVIKEMMASCRKRNIEVLIADSEEARFYNEELGLPQDMFISIPQIFADIDIAFSLGGDGTFIELARKIVSYNIPICGINLGELGFLNQIELDEIDQRLKMIINGQCRVEERIYLQAFIRTPKGNQPLVPIINEVVITREEPAKMARINLAINEGHTQMYPADGLIISTSTGSTGYNLSAGGPILAPDNRSIIVTPIAPHLLQGVSLVLKESARIDISMPKRQTHLHICVDGTFDYDFTNEDSLHIEVGSAHCKQIRFPDKKFFASLFKKLGARRDEIL